MLDRRKFMKSLGIGTLAAGLTTGTRSASASGKIYEEELCSVLTDIGLCTGCRKCEEACAEVNDLPLPDIMDKSVFDSRRKLDPDHWTVVNRHETEGGTFYVKSQCMHCNQPGCASACLVQAMEKQATGPVVWNGDRCMGCRYCMISCPFDIPKFEYDSANPRIRKCILCAERLEEGKLPACVEACPVEALLYGTRRELLEIARRRIYTNPESYHPEIYGEREVGGTSWLYLSPLPFQQLGFRGNLGETPIPEFTQDFLYAVPPIIALWPAFLYGVSKIRQVGEERGDEE